MPYVIDTVATITAVHQALSLAAQMADGPARDRLIARANEALSVCSYYMRYPRVQAKKEHYESVQRLLALIAEHIVLTTLPTIKGTV